MQPQLSQLIPKIIPNTPEESLLRMQAIINQFYREAVYANCHPFIEFAGLMEEYVKVCRHNLERGIDFRECHGHSNMQLQFESWHLNYLTQKWGCIFNGALEICEVDSANNETTPT